MKSSQVNRIIYPYHEFTWFEIQLCNDSSLLSKRIVQKVQGRVSRWRSCLLEKSDCKWKSLLRSRRYFLSHGNLRGNLDIEINNNVHHVERHNTETVFNRAISMDGIPFTMFFFARNTRLYITPLFKSRLVRSVLRCMRE